jgi:hypothetical protein
VLQQALVDSVDASASLARTAALDPDLSSLGGERLSNDLLDAAMNFSADNTSPSAADPLYDGMLRSLAGGSSGGGGGSTGSGSAGQSSSDGGGSAGQSSSNGAGPAGGNELTNPPASAGPRGVPSSGPAMLTPPTNSPLPANPAPATSTAPSTTLPPPPMPVSTLESSPVRFVQNVGQVADGQTQFVAQVAGYTTLLAPTQATFVLQNPSSGAQLANQEPTALHMTFVGANLNPQADPQNPLSGNGAFGQVTYHNLYTGIDLMWHGSSVGRVEYDFSVAPNASADTSSIPLAFQGATGLDIDNQGNLVVHTTAGDLIQRAPQLFQETQGVHQSVAGNFVLLGNNEVGINVGAYDHSRTLTIDPEVDPPGTVTYDFSSPASPPALGNSQTYTFGGVTITAYGYTTGGTAEALYGDPPGANSTGLGINGNTNHEITTSDYVQLDLGNIFTSFGHNAQLQIKIGSDQSGQNYDIYGSNSLGGALSSQTKLTNGISIVPTYIAINPGSFRYISVSAHAAEVLLADLQVAPAGVPPSYTDACT